MPKITRRDLLVGGSAGLAGAIGWPVIKGLMTKPKDEKGATPPQTSQEDPPIEPNKIYVNGDIYTNNEHSTDPRESISALEKTFDPKHSPKWDPEASEMMISNALVSLNYDPHSHPRIAGKKLGTGTLLTNDGFILTAYHCIDQFEEDWKRISKENPLTKENSESWLKNMMNRYTITTRTGPERRFTIDPSFFATNKALDIALIKAVIPWRPGPTGFSVDYEDLERNETVKLLSLRKGKPSTQYGRVIHPTFPLDTKNQTDFSTKDSFLTDAYTTPGFSGGAFATENGFAGTVLYAVGARGNPPIGYAGGAKVKNIANLVNESVQALKKHHSKK